MQSKKRIWMTQKRLEKNLTQIEVADVTGVSNRTISEIERGNRNPSGPLAVRLSNLLEVDMKMFYEAYEIA